MFIQSTMDEKWHMSTLGEKLHLISMNLEKYLPEEYHAAIRSIANTEINYGEVV